MNKPVRYQNGQLYQDHGAWYVRYRECIVAENGVIERKKRTKRLGSTAEYPTASDVEPLRAEFMVKVNSGKVTSSCATVDSFVQNVFLPHIKEEKRASTYKGYREIHYRHVQPRIGHMRLSDVRTVDISRLLKAVFAEHDLSKATLRNIKNMLSSVFKLAKNEGAYDGINPVTDALVPSKARGPRETHAYSLEEILQILSVLEPVAKAAVAVAAFAGLREGELAGLEWGDYDGVSLYVRRSVWRKQVNPPKTRASRAGVPVIPELAKIIDEYRASLNTPAVGVMFHDGSGARLDLDRMAQRVIRKAAESLGLPWYGWHGFRRGIASNLYSLGASDKVVQRVLRHSKAHVTKEHYIKAFDPDVTQAMGNMQVAVDILKQSPAIAQRPN